MMDRLCMNCRQPIDLSDYPDFIQPENPKRCAECTARALWRFMVPGSEIDDPDALNALADLVALDALNDMGKPAEER